ncbi:MAG: ATP-binding protein [Chloroflexi bacterium]|nr:ATP-binding protein [Chloroflexota bacterium]
MDFFRNQAAEHLEKGVDLQSKGLFEQARFQYLKAAEMLFKAAQQTRGEVREQRIRQAEELIERARTLEKVRLPAPVQKTEAAPESGTESGWLIAERPNVRFEDVAGLDEVKEQIRLRMIYPFTHPDEAKRFGIRTGGGILLYGPPGTGKTLIARAIAGELDAAFFSVKPSEIMSKWVGEAEQNVQKLFNAAHSYPRAVIFIDEVESLVPKRRESGSTVMQRVVPQILMELEGFEQKKGTLLFIGATNEPWSLDPAVLRPGRFDDKMYIPLPDSAARKRMLELNLKGKPLAPEMKLDEIAEMLEGYSGADIRNICDKASAIPFIEAVKTGQERCVEMRDFLTVINQVKPSVSKKDLAKFESFSFQ